MQAGEPMVQAHRPSPPRRKEAQVALPLKVEARRLEQDAQEQGGADPWKVLAVVSAVRIHRSCPRPRKGEQLGASHLKSEQQEQIILAEERKVIPELGERVAGPRKEQEEELREAHPLLFLRLMKVEQLGVSRLRSEPQEQITHAEEGKVILEIVERVADPKKEREEELKGAHHLNSLRELESQSESVQPRNLNQFFLQAG